MEDLLGPHLDHSCHHRLRHPIPHRRHAQDSRAPAVWLRDLHRAHRRREAGAGGKPVPHLVQVVLQILRTGPPARPATVLSPSRFSRLGDSLPDGPTIGPASIGTRLLRTRSYIRSSLRSGHTSAPTGSRFTLPRCVHPGWPVGIDRPPGHFPHAHMSSFLPGRLVFGASRDAARPGGGGIPPGSRSS
jgi:hypothetical protein